MVKGAKSAYRLSSEKGIFRVCATHWGSVKVRCRWKIDIYSQSAAHMGRDCCDDGQQLGV